jgi:hypothetical protein
MAIIYILRYNPKPLSRRLFMMLTKKFKLRFGKAAKKMFVAATATTFLLAGSVVAQSNIPLVSTLQKKGDVYYNPKTNAPYTGTVNPCDCDECGCGGSMEIKDGKRHGKYTMYDEEGSITGNYKDGKQHGEWKYTEESFDGIAPGDVRIEIYKDGILQKK